MPIFNTLLYQPLLQTLTFLTNVLGGSFGFAIIALTFLLRTAMIPLTLPTMRSAQKMKDIKPHLDELKRKHGKDKKRFQKEQLNLYKEHGINPAAGCLPTIVQFAILIAMYRVFIDFIENGNGGGIAADMQFLWLDLTKPDPLYILPLVAGGTQLILSQMLMAGKEHHKSEDLKKSAREKQERGAKKAKADEDKTLDMAGAMQKQMLYVMPLMTGLIALSFPSGLALYWVATTIFSLVQQYVISGPGGLATVVEKLRARRRDGK
ncbi:membrane protein insertase YidC [Patescibacteria group bacterium]|nr:membrane protein insertase YidC [Patescibacteria group bacterium]